MTVEVLGASDYRVMPWKNGLGVTTEIAVRPKGAALAGGFDWRVSLADLTVSGPFSAFPGVDRVILQTAGAPMVLTHAGTHAGRDGATTLRPLAPYAFSGDWETHGELAGTQAKDFNVMTRRGRVRARVTTVTLQGEGARYGIAFCEGDALVHVLSGAAVARTGGRELALAAGSTLLAERESGGALTVMTAGQAAVLVAVQLPSDA